MSDHNLKAKSLVSIPAEVLASLIDMAKAHVEDIETGIEDGTYLQSENPNLPEKQAATSCAEAIYRGAVLASVDNRHPDIEEAQTTQLALLKRVADLLGALIGHPAGAACYPALAANAESVLNDLEKVAVPIMEAELCDEYAKWNKEQGLNLGSADEHYFDESLSEEQRLWLQGFGERWDRVFHPHGSRATEGKYLFGTDPLAPFWRSEGLPSSPTMKG